MSIHSVDMQVGQTEDGGVRAGLGAAAGQAPPARAGGGRRGQGELSLVHSPHRAMY